MWCLPASGCSQRAGPAGRETGPTVVWAPARVLAFSYRATELPSDSSAEISLSQFTTTSFSNTNSEAHVTDYVQAPSPRRAVASPQAGQAAAPTCAALAYASPPNPGPAAVTQPPGLLSSAPRQQAWTHAKASPPSVPKTPHHG